MDHYVSEFYKNKEDCRVTDYAVYLEKKTGPARFNPFTSSDQMVIYLTDRGCFCSRVKNMGEFTMPVSLERAQLRMSEDGRMVHSLTENTVYAFVRKWKEGACASCADLSAAVQGLDR